MSKVLLVVDNPDRDLKGIALLTHWLASKHGLTPIVTTTKNELSALIAHQPALLLMPHLRYERHRPLLEFARAQGTAVGILPVEGAAGRDELIGKTVVGFEQHYPFVDLVIAWGSHVRDWCREKLPLPGAEVHSAGCPRFDFLLREYDRMAPSREEACRRYGLDPAKPIVGYFSSSKYANPPEGFDAWLAAFMRPDSSGRIIARDVNIAAKGRDHQRVYDFLTDAFVRLVRERPEANYVVKPHPGENQAPYHERFKGLPVKVMTPADQSTDLVPLVDVQLNWRCMTSGEAWYRDLQSKVISIEPPGLGMTDFELLTIGNEVVSTYEGLKGSVERYLGGAPVPAALVEQRRAYLSLHLRSHEGRAAERCADVVMEFLGRWPAPRRSLGAWSTVARALPGRLRRGRWLVMDRGPEHPKYFPPAKFHAWMRELNGVHARPVEPGQYLLDV